MKKKLQQTNIARLIVLALVGLYAFSSVSIAVAASPDSLYTYKLANSTGVIANSAAINTAVNMQLVGNWTASTTGVLFTGNTTNTRSVGYAKPSTGYTLDVPTTKAVGSTVKFVYKAPVGSGCFKDSPNLTQIGFFGDLVTQMKLQLSNCGKSTASVFPQCRFAGKLTSNTVLPVMSTQALVDGQTYIIQCAKSPDTGTGTTTLELKVTRIDSVNGNTTTTDVFTIANTGLMRSSSNLSVANKYPLPAQSSNTDQYNGEINAVSYCTGLTLVAAQTCLDSEVSTTL